MTLRHPSPLNAVEFIDEYFIENRNRVLELAAFLDRVDLAGAGTTQDDFRMQALRDALAELGGPSADRLTRIQMIFSDPTEEPLPALDRKGAVGAFDRSRQGARS